MNDSAMQLMVRAQRERLLTTMRNSGAAPEKLADPATPETDPGTKSRDGRTARIVVASGVAILSSTIFALILGARILQFATVHSADSPPTQASAQAVRQGPQEGYPAATALARGNWPISSDIAQTNHR